MLYLLRFNFRNVARRKATVETEKISITTSKKVTHFLDKLIETEIYGRTRPEVAEEIIKRMMEQFLLDPEKWKNLTRDL